MNMEQGCRAVWSILEEFFWPALPGDALLRWHPPSQSLKRISARKSESENRCLQQEEVLPLECGS